MIKNNTFQSEIQRQRVFSFPVIKLPLELYRVLLKIASFKGIPLETLAVSQLEKFAIDCRDFTENKPLGRNIK